MAWIGQTCTGNCTGTWPQPDPSQTILATIPWAAIATLAGVTMRWYLNTWTTRRRELNEEYQSIVMVLFGELSRFHQAVRDRFMNPLSELEKITTAPPNVKRVELDDRAGKSICSEGGKRFTQYYIGYRNKMSMEFLGNEAIIPLTADNILNEALYRAFSLVEGLRRLQSLPALERIEELKRFYVNLESVVDLMRKRIRERYGRE